MSTPRSLECVSALPIIVHPSFARNRAIASTTLPSQTQSVVTSTASPPKPGRLRDPAAVRALRLYKSGVSDRVKLECAACIAVDKPGPASLQNPLPIGDHFFLGKS